MYDNDFEPNGAIPLTIIANRKTKIEIKAGVEYSKTLSQNSFVLNLDQPLIELLVELFSIVYPFFLYNNCLFIINTYIVYHKETKFPNKIIKKIQK